MEYNFSEIEQRSKNYWTTHEVYKVANPGEDGAQRPKCYVLDMFPYPSGAGLHVGHPLGYIASDIYARYKRLKGFNVLHPMGFDAFGLPAEQYALETGQHPAVTTEKNIARYRQQLDNIGFCYDWSREVRTSDAKYYKWTQWIFLQLFHSWYNREAGKASPIGELIAIFEREGNKNIPCPGNSELSFGNEDWNNFSEKEQREVLMHYRLAYQGYAQVWWCEALGTVLANDEVVNGVSERGGHPVERKNMRQWFLRITEYADRLLTSLDNLEWSEAMKEMQRNWIGKSSGASVNFAVGNETITVFTTRPDTIFGVDFLVLAPEHDLVNTITTGEQKEAIAAYVQYVKSRSERERMSEVKQVTGCFTGAYATHPLTGRHIPIWISEYVLAGYGTGAIMAVPCGDDRDHAFASHFNITITNIFGDLYNGTEAYSTKSGKIDNSGFLSGMNVPEAAEAAINALVEKGIGERKINYRLRDAGFSRQRYWGEPFPIIYIDDVPYGTDEPVVAHNHTLSQLPVELPMVEHYRPGPEGQGPLANIPDWVETEAGERETNTMPGYAGSSWYFLRYMDPHNNNTFADRHITDYWNQIDLYVGGTEHAVGHLLYSRMWTKALCDLGHIGFDEPFKRLLNQGMIQGNSRFVYRLGYTWQTEPGVDTEDHTGNWVLPTIFVSEGYYKKIKKSALTAEDTQIINRAIEEATASFKAQNIAGQLSYDVHSAASLHVDVNMVDGVELDTEAFRQWRTEYTNARFILEDGKYICGSEVEKMSKSKYNVVNPDQIVADYGADTFRMYEMFLGPIDVSKPWDTKGIEGVHRFLKKVWRLFADEQTGWVVTDEAATDAELKTLHKTLKKVAEDIEKFSFNTAVSQFMICVNELSGGDCHKRAILQPLIVALTPFAPHMAEDLWQRCLGHTATVLDAAFPAYEERYVTDNSKLYPVAVNGKTRVEMEFALDAEPATIEQAVLADATVQKWMEGKAPKKVIYVKGRMINVVI